jgi:DNA (cytosine-5)-methyltransferase 1
VVELYAGTGRSLEPYRNRPEFEIALLADISHKARDAYLANHKLAPYALIDLTTASAAAIEREAGGRVDVLLGCPPCQGFSESGQRRADDPRNEHIIKFARTIRTLKPIAFAMENVPLAATSNQFALFRQIVEESGYAVAAAVLNAAEYGSAQARQRLVVVGRRGRGSGLEVTLPSPTHTPIGQYFDYALGRVREAEARDDALLGTTSSTRRAAAMLEHRFHRELDVVLPTPKVAEVIEGLPALGTDRANGLAHIPYAHGDAMLAQMAAVPEGGQRDTNGRYHGAAYARLHGQGLAKTLTRYFSNAGSGRFWHPTDNRSLTSREAARLQGFDDGFLFPAHIEENGRSLVDQRLLADEVARRVEDSPLLMTLAAPAPDERLIIAGVDGSTQGGLLSIDGTAGDFAFGAPPQINLNTAAAVLNRKLRRDDGETDVFLRLPSAPEDIQRRENVYTIMSPMFFPDLSPAEYMHSAWNAMDVLESRVARRALDIWSTPNRVSAAGSIEVNPADVVIRDGTVVPNDRDPSHYAQPDSYGRIVREMVQLSWEMAQKSRDDAHTVAGAVKNSRVRVVGPIMNWIICQSAGTPSTTLTSWALDEMNAIPDQQLLSRLLSHAESKKGSWTRSATFMRPFHATTPAFSRYYVRDRSNAPGRQIEERIRLAASTPPEKRTSDQHGWAEVRVPNSYSQMLDNVWFAGFYATPGVALSKGQALPRLELLINAPTGETGDFAAAVGEHRDRLLTALATTGFSISQDHDMFGNAGVIDFVPTMLQRAHEIVIGFARDMKARAGEYLDRLLVREIGSRRRQNVRVRPWKPEELKAWRDRMVAGREDQGSWRRRIA